MKSVRMQSELTSREKMIAKGIKSKLMRKKKEFDRIRQKYGEFCFIERGLC
jgi:hypothetical protein